MRDQSETFNEWAILELMGHRRLGGVVSEATIGGTPFIRLDVPDVDGEKGFTQFYSGQSVYCITPTTEDVALFVARQCCDRPVSAYEIQLSLPKQTATEDPEDAEDDYLP